MPRPLFTPMAEPQPNGRPTAVELFCGVGGMTLGFEQAGYDVLAAFDIEAWNVAAHKRNFPSTACRRADLSEENGASLRALAGLGDRVIDLVFGGPPCQGFSVGGARNAEDERNLLVHDFCRLVRDLSPRYFVMENVRGLLSDHAEAIFDSFRRRARRAGYRMVEPVQALNAAHFGVPQHRVRTFVLGYREDQPTPSYPTATDRPGPVIRDALDALPPVDDHEALFDEDVFSGWLELPTSPYARVMRGLDRAEDDDSPRRAVPRRRLTGCLRTRHSKDTTRRFRDTRQGEQEPISRYIRLKWDGISTTLRAGTDRKHGAHTAPRPIHPSIPRCVTTREAARLHSLPDWFRFHGDRWHDFRQIGNSVPPLLARAVARAMRATIEAT
jgi:DNA (cytosine-5)-methyltransferase 1